MKNTHMFEQINHTPHPSSGLTSPKSYVIYAIVLFVLLVNLVTVIGSAGRKLTEASLFIASESRPSFALSLWHACKTHTFRNKNRSTEFMI